MALTAGSRLGSYEIVALLGAGGMGEIYRARNPKLNRHVAVLADLNHPNIAAIYRLEESGDRRFLVLEFVDGRLRIFRLTTADC